MTLFRNEVFGPLFVRGARPVRHRVGESDPALVEDHEPAERSQAVHESRGDPVLGEEFERE